MQQRFPRDESLWMRQVEALLVQLCVDRDRLMRLTPQIPDPEAGIAFTGPLSPTPYEFVGVGGDKLSGTRPLSGHIAASGTNNTGS